MTEHDLLKERIKTHRYTEAFIRAALGRYLDACGVQCDKSGDLHLMLTQCTSYGLLLTEDDHNDLIGHLQGLPGDDDLNHYLRDGHVWLARRDADDIVGRIMEQATTKRDQSKA